MANIFDDNSRSIGRTPLVRLGRISKDLPATIVAKTIIFFMQSSSWVRTAG